MEEASMIFNREPALVLGFIATVLALAIGFGADITQAQVGLIMAAVSALFAVVVRHKVTPTDAE
jgi:hypothetical protein